MDNNAFDETKPTGEEDRNSLKHDPSVEISVHANNLQPTEPYSGMGKEDLLRFSTTPFWSRLRLGCVLVFWTGWAALLIAVMVLTVGAPRCDPSPTRDWWQKGNYYQLFVNSFFDSNDDGEGDIKGITSKLDYLVSTSSDAVVLSSIYVNNGELPYQYAIINHTQVDPRFGEVSDVEELITAAHDKGLKVILEFIPNHVSTLHPWFVNRADDDLKNFFVWTDCDTAPNWIALYDGPAWHDDPDGTYPGECYLGQVSKDHPDLNLRVERVRQELDDILRFWLELGVDGFRINAAHLLYEDFELRDEEDVCVPGDSSYACTEHEYTTHQFENVDLIARWRDVLQEYGDDTGTRVLIADVYGNGEQTAMYLGTASVLGAHTSLYYGLNDVLSPSCDGECVRSAVIALVTAAKVDDPTFAWLTSGQDVMRLSSKKGDIYVDAINMLRMTLLGVGMSFYGEELGTLSGEYGVTDCKDIWFQNATYEAVFCRDNSRTLMAWTEEGGFNNNGSTWINYSPSYQTNNVQVQEGGENDLTHLKLMKALSETHRDYAALHFGSHTFLDMEAVDSGLIAYVREYEGVESLLVAINFGNSTVTTSLREKGPYVPSEAEVVMSTVSSGDYTSGDTKSTNDVKLNRGEGVIFMWAYERE